MKKTTTHIVLNCIFSMFLIILLMVVIGMVLPNYVSILDINNMAMIGMFSPFGAVFYLRLSKEETIKDSFKVFFMIIFIIFISLITIKIPSKIGLRY